MDEITRIAAEADSKNVVVEEVAKPEGEAKFDSLSKTEALKEAINYHKQAKEESLEQNISEEPTNREVKAAVDADIEPPQEFSAEAKKAWKAKDVLAIQKEFRRLHDGRTQEISRVHNEMKKVRETVDQETKTYRDLAKMAAPYIEAQGQQGVPPEKAIMQALALINEFKKADPATVKAELKNIGIDLDKAPGQTTVAHDPKIDTIQTRLEVLEKEKEEVKFQKLVQTFDTVFTTLTSQKNRTGDCVFPDLLDNSEAGRKFASDLGSLTQDSRFQAGVLRRFPDADLTVVVREAYKYLGGKVSGEPVKVSTSNQQHIDKSRRAAASTPGRTVSRNESSNLIGKLDRSAAIRQAIRDNREKYN